MNTTRNKRLDSITYLLIAALLIQLALMALEQGNPGTRLPRRDSGAFLYIGDQILHGKLPYRDAWDSKPPAIFYLDAAALVIGRGSRWGVWMIEFVSLFAAGLFSYISVKKLWGTLPAIGALILWIIGFSLALEGGNFTEEYPLSLHFFSFILFLKLMEVPKNRLYSFLLGLAFSISFLFRPNNAVVEAVILLTFFLLQIMQRNWRVLFTQILWAGSGILLPILITGFYFWRQGILSDAVEASIFYNFTYSNTAITTTSPLVAGFRIFGWLAWIATAGYLIALYYALTLKQSIYFLLLIGWPLIIYMSDLAKRNYPHYFINWLPFLCLLSGLTLHLLTSRLSARIKRPLLWERIALGTSAVGAFAFFLIGGHAIEYEKAIQRIANRDAIGIEIRTRTAAYVENHTQPSDLVLFWAASPGENFMSNRATPSASLFYPLYLRSNIAKQLSDQFLQDVESTHPILIVDLGDEESLSLDPKQRTQQIADGFAWEYPPDNLDEFFRFVEENYYLEAKVGNKTIYRIR